MSVVRGTTPTFVLTIVGDYDLDHATDIWVTLTQGGTQMTKKWKRGETVPGISVDGQYIVLKLLQSEMFGFKEGFAQIQVKMFENDNDDETIYDNVAATTIKTIKINRILNEEAMK